MKLTEVLSESHPGIVGVDAYWNGELLANGATSFNVPSKAGMVTYVDLRRYSE
jgi:hypothetical protein